MTQTWTMPFRDGYTWYRMDRCQGPGEPLIVLHGGPGATHDYLTPLTTLVEDGHSVLLYDQFGTGRSSRRPYWDPSKFTMDLYLDELAQVIHSAPVSGFHLLGHSWGGMLAVEYALRHQDRIFAGKRQLLSLTLSDTMAATDLIAPSVEARREAIRAELGPGADEDTVEQLFAERNICRVPMTDELAYSFAQLAENRTIHDALGGRDGAPGTLTGWSSIDRLHRLTVPTLVLAGEHDQVSEIAWGPFVDRIPGVASHVFAGASHVPFIESPEEYRTVLRDFLRAQENRREG